MKTWLQNRKGKMQAGEDTSPGCTGTAQPFLVQLPIMGAALTQASKRYSFSPTDSNQRLSSPFVSTPVLAERTTSWT